MAACAEAWITPALGEATLPDPDLSRLYQRLYPVYRSIREVMSPSWRRLAEARQESA